MLNRLDNGFELLDNTDWHMDFYGPSDDCEVLCTAAEAITSPLLVNAIDANFYDDSSSKTIFWLRQDAGKPVEYSCLVQDGKNVNDGTEGEAKSVAEAITALNKWLAAHDEPLLAVEKPLPRGKNAPRARSFTFPKPR